MGPRLALLAVPVVVGGFLFAWWLLENEEPRTGPQSRHAESDGGDGRTGRTLPPSPLRSRPFTGEEESADLAEDADRPRVLVSFKMIEAGEPALKADGFLELRLQSRAQATVRIVQGRSVEPVSIPEGHHGMQVRMQGRVRRTGWSFDVLASRGDAQTIEVDMPPTGVTITGIAADGAGTPLAEGTPLLLRLAGTFSAPVPDPRWPDVHRQSISVKRDGHWSYEIEGSVSRAALGVWREARKGEAWAFFPTPLKRALVREGEVWDVGRIQVTEIPVLLTADVTAAPDLELHRPISMRWEFAPVEDPGSRRGFGLNATIEKDLTTPLRLLGETSWSPFEVSVTGYGFESSGVPEDGQWRVPENLQWRCREPVVQGSHVSVVLERSRKIVAILDLPTPPPGVRLLVWREGRFITERVIKARSRDVTTEGRCRTPLDLDVCSGAYSITLRCPFSKPWRSKEIVVPATGTETRIDLGTIRLGDGWSRTLVTVKNADGGALASPEATVVGPGGETTCSGRAGKVWIPVPLETANLHVWISGRGHVAQLHSLDALPTVVRLERGAFISVEPGFDPTEIAWPGGVRVTTRLEMDSSVPISPVYGTTLEVDSALGVTFGPLPPGSARLWMHLAYAREGGQLVSRAWNIGSVEVPAGSEDLEIKAPEAIRQGIRDQLEREAGR